MLLKFIDRIEKWDLMHFSLRTGGTGEERLPRLLQELYLASGFQLGKEQRRSWMVRVLEPYSVS